MVETQQRRYERVCAKAHIVTHVNNEHIVVYHQVFFENEFGHCVLMQHKCLVLHKLPICFLHFSPPTPPLPNPKESDKVLVHQLGYFQTRPIYSLQ